MSTNGNLDMSPASPVQGAPKFGTLVPNRIFVGGISANTTEAELHSLFSKYGNVKATKIIMDKAGISKGYGFVTFETEEEAQRIQKEARVDSIILKERKLNIAPAIKKQPFTRVIADPTQMMSNGTILYQGSVPQNYSSTALLTGSENLYLPQTSYPVIYPQPVYLPQHQYHYQPSASAGFPTQYVYTAMPVPPDYYQYNPSMPSHLGNPSSEYAESSASEASSEGGKTTNYSKQSIVPITSGTGDYDNNSRISAKPSRMSSNAYRNATSGSQSTNTGNSSITSSNNSSHLPSHPFHQLPPSHHLHHHLLAKTVNGVAVMAYPSSIVMGTPTFLHVKDTGNGDQESIMTELGFLHSPLASGALTPPPTPLTPIPCDFSSAPNIESGRKN